MRHRSLTKLPGESHFFSEAPAWRWFVLGFLFLCAAAVRLYGIDEYPMDFQPVKQYRSAMTARLYYYESIDSVSEWEREVARANVQQLGRLGPAVLEWIAALTYLIAGGEYLWIPRLLSALSWLVGGVFLYQIARITASLDAAIVSTAYYLLNPFGVIASQSFQPDPLMVMTMVISLFAIIRYHQSASWRRLIIAAMISSMAILIKPVSAFFVFTAFTSLAIFRQGFRKSAQGPAMWTFIIISLLPNALYYGHSIFMAGYLRDQAQASFIPSLLLDTYFWQFWFKHIYRVIGFAALVAALLGVLLVPAGWRRMLILGLWIGYVLYGLAFTYHIHTHNYYHLPFMPVVALSVGPLAAMVLRHFAQLDSRWPMRTVVGCILLLAVFLNVGLYVRERQEMPDFGQEVELAQEISQLVDHSTHTLLLSPFGGRPLRYHGEFSGGEWPTLGDMNAERLMGRAKPSVEARFSAMCADLQPEYFVVTDFGEYAAQEDLRGFLEASFPIVIENDRYIIFDLRSRFDSKE